MSVINVLDPHVADMIAAGEVVERPGSVVKELMENAVDAGARNITVELRNGGATFIRVTDDGCGMAADDASYCFLRHATSKLRDEYGLEAISTMGFRGEALAAISAVSQIELLTRREEDQAGTLVTISGGDIQDIDPAGCPKGSVFTVKNLFFNTPARLKFMKSDRTEGSWCVQTALRVALGKPDISVRCIRDGKEEFFTPGDGRPESAIYALLGRDAALSMLPVREINEKISVTGFIGSPSACRGNRSMQFFFVNGRSIRSLSLQTALEQAYKNTKMVGRFPSCVIYVSISPGSVDVNVHPTKNEVKFSDEKKVFNTVYYGALNTLQTQQDTVELHLSGKTEEYGRLTGSASEKKLEPDTVPSAAEEKPSDSAAAEQIAMEMPGHTYSYSGITPSLGTQPHQSPERSDALPQEDAARTAHPASEIRPYSVPADTHETKSPQEYRASAGPAKKWESWKSIENQEAKNTLETPEFQKTDVSHEISGPTYASELQKSEVPNVQSTPTGLQAPARMVGEVLHTYIIVEQGDRVLLIDKHAAHERLIFDALKAQGREILSQGLLVPQTWKPGQENMEILEGNSALLQEMGFELEAYGEEDIIVRAIPEAMDPAQIIPGLEEICENLKHGSRDLIQDEILQTISCKAAIKAGWDTDPLELQVLADKVISGQIKYCPHGRPVAMTLTKRELDRQFGRLG